MHLGTMVTPAGKRPVALKQLLRKDVTSATALEQITAEARLVFQLTHANICQVLDLAMSDEGTFIVMEYVDGCDLKTLLARSDDATMPLPAAVHIAKEISQALDYAHRRRDAHGRALWLIHGDVTPQNILLSREGEVKLADFGIARSLVAQAPGNQFRAGTPGYIAPEMREGESDQRADIYSLGMTLYVALVGAPPTGGQVQVETLANKRPEIDQELTQILKRALQPRRSERYASAAEMHQALSLHLAHRYPAFTAAKLAELVQARTHVSEASFPEEGVSVDLVSLTGTATLLAPMETVAGAEISGAPPGTRRVAPKTGTPSHRRLAVAVGTAVVLIALITVGAGWIRMDRSRAVAPQPTAEADALAVQEPQPPTQPTPPAEVLAPPLETTPRPDRNAVPRVKAMKHRSSRDQELSRAVPAEPKVALPKGSPPTSQSNRHQDELLAP